MLILLLFMLILLIINSNRLRNPLRRLIHNPDGLRDLLLERRIILRFLKYQLNNGIVWKSLSAELTAMLFGSLASFLHGKVDFGSGGGSLKFKLIDF